jgi:hypothetical protein
MVELEHSIIARRRPSFQVVTFKLVEVCEVCLGRKLKSPSTLYPQFANRARCGRSAAVTFYSRQFGGGVKFSCKQNA